MNAFTNCQNKSFSQQENVCLKLSLFIILDDIESISPSGEVLRHDDAVHHIVGHLLEGRPNVLFDSNLGGQ